MTVKIIFGAASFNDPEKVKPVFETLKKQGVNILDTARLYGSSEEIIGKTPGHEDFIVDTKLQGGFVRGTATREGAISDAQDSLKKVGVKQFDILYIHAPDDTIPIAQTLEGVNDAYKQGIFKRFGLSNFTAEQVQEVYDISKSKGWVLPTVYQGNYSAVARKLETLLFPTLRKLGIAFYAYSPIAGGFLTKTKQQVQDGAGRFSKDFIGGLYYKLYHRPSYLEALAEWNDIAEKEGIPKAELAYRWVAYHSFVKEELGDGVIFGASSLEQIEQTVQGLRKGPLSADAVKRIEAVWRSIEHEAPVDNWEVMSKV
ncbi:aldehyde reductase [Zopfia rhizophila CBS 207.26]|uniref:Aldehyde reductase n=1 Tax=Zopfia rhizophila CBS 207.26 TaxID=1314779 RepID=A0A6A6DLL7_9PEZI|nr:aldehyde reductase [Zopfia rhizophila CBS 207.26]